MFRHATRLLKDPISPVVLRIRWEWPFGPILPLIFQAGEAIHSCLSIQVRVHFYCYLRLMKSLGRNGSVTGKRIQKKLGCYIYRSWTARSITPLPIEILVFLGDNIDRHEIHLIHRKVKGQVMVQTHKSPVSLFLRLVAYEEIDQSVF